MSWTTPMTFSSGSVLTAAQLNTYVRDNTNYLKSVAHNTVATAESTSSTSYVDLATVGPTVTVTTTTQAIVIVTTAFANNTNSTAIYMGFAVTGATTLSANDNQTVNSSALVANTAMLASAVFLLTNLNAGSNTFKAKYKVGSGASTGTWSARELIVIPA